MKKLVSTILAAIVALGTSAHALHAAQVKPVAVVGVASYDELLANVKFAGQLIDRPDLGTMFEGLVAMATQGKGLAGLDKTRPAGIVMQASGAKNDSAYIFLPVTDFHAVLDLLSMFATVEPQGNVYKLTPKNGSKIGYAKTNGKWAYFAEKAAMLEHCDANPALLLKGLDKRYLLAGRIMLSNLPQERREKLISDIKDGMQRESHQRPGESAEDFQTRVKIAEKLAPIAFQTIDELDQVSLGWGIDRSTQKTFLDLDVTAKPGTTTAKEIVQTSEATSAFSAFHIPGAAGHAALAGILTPTKKDALTTIVQSVRSAALQKVEKQPSADEAALAKEVVSGVGNLLLKVIEGGRVDAAASVVVRPDTATALLAGYVADGAELDELLHTFYKAAESKNPAVAAFVKFDVEEAAAVKFHKISLPIPAGAKDRDKAVQLLGENLEIAIGIGKEDAYLAFGRDALNSLKKAVAAAATCGKKAVLPVDISISASSLAQFVAVMGEPKDRAGAAAAAGELKKSPGRDHISLVAQPIANGIQYHLEVEEGIVRAFGRLVAVAAQGGASAPRLD